MILFQNKIIYMPSMPPFSRSEKISDYTRSCSPVIWEEKKIKSIDGTTITLCVGNMPARLDPAPPKHTAILYFQGNGSSLPPRLPGLSSVLRALSNNSEHTYSIIALSYRGYWTSRGAPSERGISMDAQSVIAYTLAQYPDSTLILWGQSLGASVATTATARYFSDLSHSSSLTEENAKVNPSQSRINALILETPFLSIRSMLTELYPQRWLPYRYLHPFLWNHWESEAALRIVSSTSRSKGIEAPRMLILQAENDEVVPAMQSERLEEVGREVGLGVERKVVRGSLHTEVLVKAQGRAEVVRFLQENV
ncbi:MAG: hypothetical protein M1820_005653 [Bogoriella megaspora]|nr:MAG: hypothetical protein M1820_005653 [Bogoriella megaspora]